jgi:hypothetical protein
MDTWRQVCTSPLCLVLPCSRPRAEQERLLCAIEAKRWSLRELDERCRSAATWTVGCRASWKEKTPLGAKKGMLAKGAMRHSLQSIRIWPRPSQRNRQSLGRNSGPDEARLPRPDRPTETSPLSRPGGVSSLRKRRVQSDHIEIRTPNRPSTARMRPSRVSSQIYLTLPARRGTRRAHDLPGGSCGGVLRLREQADGCLYCCRRMSREESEHASI